MNSTDFWSEIGSKKNFTDPFFEQKFSAHVSKTSKIIEYGCGYGRILSKLSNLGYRDLTGFDFAPKMIERGKHESPQLDLRLIENSNPIPLSDASVDGVILSTVLCCNSELLSQKKIISEIERVLKIGGIIYLCDFLITDGYLSRYSQYSVKDSDDFGIYKTNEGVYVRHHTIQWIMQLLQAFDIHWLEKLDAVTMNGNAVRTFHLIGKKL